MAAAPHALTKPMLVPLSQDACETFQLWVTPEFVSPQVLGMWNERT